MLKPIVRFCEEYVHRSILIGSLDEVIIDLKFINIRVIDSDIAWSLGIDWRKQYGRYDRVLVILVSYFY